MLLNFCVWEDSWESLGLQGDQISLSLRKSNWIFIGRTDAKTETPILWPPDAKNWFIREKTLMLGKTEGRRTRGHQRMRWLDGITDLMDMSFSKLMGDSEGQGSLACRHPWSCKESGMIEWLNNSCLAMLYWYCRTTMWTSCKYTHILFLLSLSPTFQPTPLGYHWAPG